MNLLQEDYFVILKSIEVTSLTSEMAKGKWENRYNQTFFEDVHNYTHDIHS